MAKRDYKTVSEWKKAYRDKAKLMNERGYRELQPKEFYRAIFPEGSLQSREHDGKGNIIATQIRPSGKGRTKQWVIDDSLDMLDKVIGDSFGLIPPLSFYGKTHTKENAHQLFAMAIDIDYVGLQQLKNMLKQFGNGVQLCPTFLVSSGKGVHLYYLLKEPVELYANREKLLSALKEDFIRRHWNDTSSIRPDNPDITGVYQGFRCVGKVLNLASNYASLFTYLMNGLVVFHIGIPCAVSNILGNLLGSHFALKKGARFIRPMMLVVLVLLLGKLISDAVL